ncbi:MAG TPA: hypothetical protein VIV58_02910, partial [Kofleriaceae bacterium]
GCEVGGQRDRRGRRAVVGAPGFAGWGGRFVFVFVGARAGGVLERTADRRAGHGRGRGVLGARAQIVLRFDVVLGEIDRRSVVAVALATPAIAAAAIIAIVSAAALALGRLQAGLALRVALAARTLLVRARAALLQRLLWSLLRRLLLLLLLLLLRLLEAVAPRLRRIPGRLRFVRAGRIRIALEPLACGRRAARGLPLRRFSALATPAAPAPALAPRRFARGTRGSICRTRLGGAFATITIVPPAVDRLPALIRGGPTFIASVGTAHVNRPCSASCAITASIASCAFAL